MFFPPKRGMPKQAMGILIVRARAPPHMFHQQNDDRALVKAQRKSRTEALQ